MSWHKPTTNTVKKETKKSLLNAINGFVSFEILNEIKSISKSSGLPLTRIVSYAVLQFLRSGGDVSELTGPPKKIELKSDKLKKLSDEVFEILKEAKNGLSIDQLILFTFDLKINASELNAILEYLLKKEVIKICSYDVNLKNFNFDESYYVYKIN